MRNGFLLFFCISFFTMYSADLYAQTCKPDIPASTPNWQLTDHGNGTVTDIKTGLMWKKCLEGLSGSACTSGSVSLFTWQQALAQPGNNSGFAGYNDWRLPNIKELNSIVEEKCHAPAINLNRFPNTPDTSNCDRDSYVWSGSPVAANEDDNAWAVGFFSGHTSFSFGCPDDPLYPDDPDRERSRRDELGVRLVRAGK